MSPMSVAAAVGDVAQVFLEHRRVEPRHAARHRVFGVAVLQIDRLAHDLVYFLAEFRRPQVRVFHLDRVDEIDAEISAKVVSVKTVMAVEKVVAAAAR